MHAVAPTYVLFMISMDISISDTCGAPRKVTREGGCTFWLQCVDFPVFVPAGGPSVLCCSIRIAFRHE